jgi:hypothetical protein
MIRGAQILGVDMNRLLAFLAAILIAAPAWAASIVAPTNLDVPGMTNALAQYNALVNAGITPNSMAPPVLGRNYLDNGAMAVNQQGTATITGGTTSITALQFAADRWFVDTNVGSGAGQAAVITSSPSPPPGFTQSVKMWRNSGALLQPVCSLHEIETIRSTQIQGQPVIFSVYVQPLAGFTAAAGLIQAYIISGTGTDQGLGTLTASPAITPAWTGIAGGTTAVAAGTLSPSWSVGTTAAWTRLYTQPFPIPLTATEVGVELCFTPVGSSSGATDGFAFTGAQLEVAGANNLAPSPFEFKPLAADLRDAQRFFYQINETATLTTPISCGSEAVNTQTCTFPLPVPMRGTTPVVVIPTTGTFKQNVAGSATTWATPTAGNCGTTACLITSATTAAAGLWLGPLVGSATTGVIYVKSDVIM